MNISSKMIFEGAAGYKFFTDGFGGAGKGREGARLKSLHRQLLRAGGQAGGRRKV